MRKQILPLSFLLACVLCSPLAGKDPYENLRKTIEKSTLNRPSTKPFHLKAEIVPTRDPDKAPNMQGTVEIWWNSPNQWKREVHSPDFQQVEILNGNKEWQRNSGEYF